MKVLLHFWCSSLEPPFGFNGEEFMQIKSSFIIGKLSVLSYKYKFAAVKK